MSQPQPRLETPSIEFHRVPDGCSVARPIVVSHRNDQPVELEVAIPPLAPFSVIDAPVTAGAPTDEAGRTRVWIRYDAARPMARDEGEVVVTAPGDGLRWRVRLSGTESLSQR